MKIFYTYFLSICSFCVYIFGRFSYIFIGTYRGEWGLFFVKPLRKMQMCNMLPNYSYYFLISLCWQVYKIFGETNIMIININNFCQNCGLWDYIGNVQVKVLKFGIIFIKLKHLYYFIIYFVWTFGSICTLSK